MHLCPGCEQDPKVTEDCSARTFWSSWCILQICGPWQKFAGRDFEFTGKLKSVGLKDTCFGTCFSGKLVYSVQVQYIRDALGSPLVPKEMAPTDVVSLDLQPFFVACCITDLQIQFE